MGIPEGTPTFFPPPAQQPQRSRARRAYNVGGRKGAIRFNPTSSGARDYSDYLMIQLEVILLHIIKRYINTILKRLRMTCPTTQIGSIIP